MSARTLAAVLAAALAAGAAACGGGATTCTDDCADAGKDASTGGGGGSGGPCDKDADCSGGRACCAGECVDTETDALHCGACGSPCGEPQFGTSSCVGGQCTLACFPNRGDCDLVASNGCEANLNNDAKNCGACGKACLFANATPDCDNQQCIILSCNAGFADCNNDPSDGCETDLSNDPNNCKSCGNACMAATNAQAYCLAGECTPGACVTGFADCNAEPNDGCEVDLFSDPNNCSSCGTVCPPLPHADSVCTNAACVVGTCEPGFADCDTSVWSGCESELATDVKNCNACGNACPAVANGTPGCSSGMCGIAACDPGFADCDGDPSNGCEVNLANDAMNCAACGNACPPVANGSPVCAGFQCGIGMCVAPFADCFSGAVDGCETNLQTSVDHCNACGNACPTIANGTRGCTNGTCGIAACAGSYGDCNNSATDGCESDRATDVNNCGTCGNVCPTPTNGTAGCVSGQCVLAACNTGYSNCDGDVSNGCEADTSSAPNACGGCGIVCGSGSCAASKCQCLKTVLLIADDSATGTATLGTALTAAGYTVTQTAVPVYQYNGTNPAPAGFGAIVLLTGGSTSSTTDMPAAGQTAIVNYVNAGNGLVLTEWAAYHVAQNRWQTLAPMVLLTRTQAYTGQVTYTVDGPFASHPIWAGLPTAFTFASTSNVGLARTAPGITRVAGSAQAIDGVAIRDLPAGRVAHIAHAGNYAPNGWTNTNVQKLVANAVGWVARCN